MSESSISEGEVITSRDWSWYQRVLGIRAAALSGELVLNFGAGGSNLGGEAVFKKLKCRMIDLDLKFDPKAIIRDHPFLYPERSLPYISAHLLYQASKFLHAPPTIQGKLYSLERQVLDMRNRNFIRGDGRTLPFPDQIFDHVLTLWSTYQIPNKDKEIIYRELMRVGKILHIGPIFGKDYQILEKLAPQLGFEVVACQPLKVDETFFPGDTILPHPFSFSSTQDYDDYVKKNSPSSRIIPPKRQEVLITNVGIPATGAKVEGGSTIVLRRVQ